MGFIQVPALRTVDRGTGKIDSIVTASYNFGQDPPKPLTQIPGRNGVPGTSFTIDLSSIARPRTLPAIRSMQFTTEFQTEQPIFDGPLFFYVPATGELLEFGPALWIQPSTPPFNSGAWLTAVIGLVCAAPTQIVVAKSAGSDNTGAVTELFGTIFLSLYDFDRQPYIAQGFYNPTFVA